MSHRTPPRVSLVVYGVIAGGFFDSMLSPPAKTRRELLGVLAGATTGGGLGFALTFLDRPFPEFFAVVLAVIGAILVGGYFRGELGWMAYGAVLGAVLADF